MAGMVDNRLLKELHRLDLSIYTAVAKSPTPSLDSGLRQLSHAADYSRLSFTAAAALALFPGPRGRRAAARGVASIAVTSAVMNAFIKPVARRRRPDRPAGPPLSLLATLVAYSRIHTGVHYPGDVVIGALCGVTLAEATNLAIDRLVEACAKRG